MPADRILRTKDLIRPGEKIYIGYFGGDSTEHKHEFIELVYVVSGTAKHLHEGEKSRIKPGDCFLIDIGSRHGYCEATQDFTIINCLFTPSFLSSSLKDDQLFKSLACNVFVTMESAGKQGRIFASRAAAPGVYAVLMQMINEFRDKKEGYLEILQALLKVALIYIFRGIETAPGPKIVTDIIEYIYAACDKKLNVETLGSHGEIQRQLLSVRRNIKSGKQSAKQCKDKGDKKSRSSCACGGGALRKMRRIRKGARKSVARGGCRDAHEARKGFAPELPRPSRLPPAQNLPQRTCRACLKTLGGTRRAISEKLFRYTETIRFHNP